MLSELRRGVKGIDLKDYEREALFNYMQANVMNCRDMSKIIKISYMQFYMPLVGKNRCSRESFKKIVRFIEKKCPQSKDISCS
jgi:hypothetical protein